VPVPPTTTYATVDGFQPSAVVKTIKTLTKQVQDLQEALEQVKKTKTSTHDDRLAANSFKFFYIKLLSNVDVFEHPPGLDVTKDAVGVSEDVDDEYPRDDVGRRVGSLKTGDWIRAMHPLVSTRNPRDAHVMDVWLRVSWTLSDLETRVGFIRVKDGLTNETCIAQVQDMPFAFRDGLKSTVASVVKEALVTSGLVTK
jgi:hypothetical protein